VVRRSDHIVTISHATRLDIQKEYGTKLDKISVFYPGDTDAFGPKGRVHKEHIPYFLFVGSLTKTKNIPFALRAFKLFLETAKTPHQLLLVGGDYWPDSEIDETIKNLRLDTRVRKMGVISDEKLAQMYRGAVALVVSSHQEGFCLPAAEAMASGTPVISVDQGAMKEIVGPGGIVVSPATEELFAQAMNTIANNDVTRGELGNLARKVSARYSWNTFATGVLDIVNHYAHPHE
jgi:glycosyltransferase involved in cell wall biosynthesis